MITVNLDVMMAKRKMSLSELSARVGITQANLSILKNNRAKAVRLETLNRICEVLACQPGDLLEWTPDEKGEIPADAGISPQPSAAVRQRPDDRRPLRGLSEKEES